MPIPNDYREIVDLLARKTAHSEVHWQVEPFNQISILFNGSKILLWAGADEDTELSFVAFALQDETGTNLDNWYVEEHEDEYKLMENFYKDAKRHAIGVSQRLTNLRDSLKKAIEIGTPKTTPG